MRTPYAQHQGDGCDGKRHRLYCTYVHYSRKIIRQDKESQEGPPVLWLQPGWASAPYTGGRIPGAPLPSRPLEGTEAASGAARPGSAARGRPVSAAADTPSPLGCPRRRLGCLASTYHEGWAPSNACPIAALLAVRPAPCSGFSRTPHAASAPCARGRASVLGPAHPRAVPVLASSRYAASECCARRQHSRPPPEGAPAKPKPPPGQAECKCSSGAGFQRSRPSPAGGAPRQP